jgi:multimeric flavodoxin WrbA
MKLLVLNGSYRKNGNTAQVTAQIVEQFRALAERRSEAVSIETVFLAHEALEPCRGCRACFDRGEDQCPQKDAVPALRARLRQADGVLIACPVYVDDVNSITKTFIDRMAYACHRPEFAGKCAYLLATVASSPTSHALGTLRMAFSTWGFSIIGSKGFKTGALMKPGEAKRLERQTGQIAVELLDALEQKKALQPSFYSLMVFAIQQVAWSKMPGETVDYTYWKSRGWLDPHRDFYIPHRSSRVKVLLARGLGKIMAPFVA